MSPTDLTEYTRELIVLKGPDAWKQTDYLENARRAGMPLDKAVELATAVAAELNRHQDRIERFRTSLLQEYERRPVNRRNTPPDEQLLGSWLADLHPLQLSETFVRDRWIPALIAPLPPIITEPVVAKVVAPPRPSEPMPALVVVPPPPVKSPPRVRKFTATPARVQRGQNVVLEWDVDGLLTVTVDEVGAGLSPTNRGEINPKKTADYRLFDADDTLLSTIRVEVIPPDRSGLYGGLFALALLAVIYWYTRTTIAGPDPVLKPKRHTEIKTGQPTKKTARSGRRTLGKQRLAAKSPKVIGQATDVTAATEPQKKQRAAPEPDPPTQPLTPADARVGKYEEAFGDKPYDKIEIDADDLGWRRARIKGRWGYFIKKSNEWVIQPDFEAITRFRGSTAAAFLNGQLITINREGEQVRK